MSAQQRDLVEGVTVLFMVAAIIIALWLLSGATHLPA